MPGPIFPTVETPEIIEGIDVFHIADWNMEKVHKKVEKLNKKAAQLNCPPIEIKLINIRFEVDPKYRDQIAKVGAENLPQIRVHDIQIVGEGPIIAGWKFVGTMDHYTFPGQVVVQTVPGETVPEEYFYGDPTCDHCNKIRSRKETFVLQDEDGGHQQVGRSCLKDFLGVDPQRIGSFLQGLYREIEEMGRDDWGYSGGGSYEVAYDIDRVLQVAAAIIEKKGWVPGSLRSEEVTATSDRVRYYFNRPYYKDAVRDWEDFVAEMDAKNPKYIKEAADAREWLLTQDENNEYMHNLHMINDAEKCPSKMLGYWVSLVSAFQRDQDRLNKIKLEKKTRLNEYYGAVKERVEMEITVDKKRPFDGYYGTSVMVSMRTKEGHTIVWFANTDVEMEKGQRYKVKATVKEHSEYNEWKQTKVLRLKVLESLDEATNAE